MTIQITRHTIIPAGFMQIRAPKTAAAAVGWWVVPGKTCVAAYQAKGAASLAASYVNLPTPATYDLTLFGSGLTWDAADGWGTNWATNRFLHTGITPANDGSWSMFVRYSAASASYAIAVGACKVSNTAGFAIGSGSSQRGWFVNVGALVCSVAPNYPAGVFGVTTEPYRDGVDVGVLSGSNPPASPIAIGGLYSMPILVSNVWAGYIQAVAIYSMSLSPAEAATLSAAMAAL